MHHLALAQSQSDQGGSLEVDIKGVVVEVGGRQPGVWQGGVEAGGTPRRGRGDHELVGVVLQVSLPVLLELLAPLAVPGFELHSQGAESA